MQTPELETLVPDIRALARTSPRQEVCGLVSDKGALYPVANASDNPHAFVLERRGYLQALAQMEQKGERPVCVYHSHLGRCAAASPEDRRAVQRCQLDYLIVAREGTDWSIVCYEP